MTQKFDIGLNAKLNEFAEKFEIDRQHVNDSKIFEDFANYIVISTILKDEFEEINKVSTNKAQGVDGIGIFINDCLISEVSDLSRLGENEKLKVQIGFIQATIQDSFKEPKFSSFTNKVVDLLVGNLKIEPFSTILSTLLSDELDYIDNLADTPKISLYYVSGKTSHTLSETFLNSEKDKIRQREELKDNYILDNIYFWQKDEIKEAYVQIAKYHKVTLKFYKDVQLEVKNEIKISLLAAIKFSELKKLILTEDENIKEKLFVENPRAHLGQTNVNNDIKNTLNDENYNLYFIYLNNGLTILCDSIERHPTKPEEYTLTYPRIINGCQTTHILYEKYKERPEGLNNVEVIVKVIATENSDLKKQIIFAANNQNSIDKDLQSLNEFHEKIEQYFKGVNTMKLFFERLRGQYPNINPPYKKINIENLAKVYISVFLTEPHKMKSNAIKRINEYQDKKKIFNNGENNINDYYYCGVLYYWLNKFILNKNISLKSKTMDMHLLLTCDLQLQKEGKNDTAQKIDFLKDEENARKSFYEANQYLENQEYLFERRGFYSSPKTKKLIDSFS